MRRRTRRGHSLSIRAPEGRRSTPPAFVAATDPSSGLSRSRRHCQEATRCLASAALRTGTPSARTPAGSTWTTAAGQRLDIEPIVAHIHLPGMMPNHTGARRVTSFAWTRLLAYQRRCRWSRGSGRERGPRTSLSPGFEDRPRSTAACGPDRPRCQARFTPSRASLAARARPGRGSRTASAPKSRQPRQLLRTPPSEDSPRRSCRHTACMSFCGSITFRPLI
jgi:hypothetical protein